MSKLFEGEKSAEEISELIQARGELIESTAKGDKQAAEEFFVLGGKIELASRQNVLRYIYNILFTES